VFRGINFLNLDAKGRLSLPSRARERLSSAGVSSLVLTLNPLDRCVWLYPLPEWEVIDAKLGALSDFDKRSRRTKQMMRGHACDCDLDKLGRILIPRELREFAGLDKSIALLGQGNKLELWNAEVWNQQREQWLSGLDEDEADTPEPLRNLSL
jgi:MraZ protein